MIEEGPWNFQEPKVILKGKTLRDNLFFGPTSQQEPSLELADFHDGESFLLEVLAVVTILVKLGSQLPPQPDSLGCDFAALCTFHKEFTNPQISTE